MYNFSIEIQRLVDEEMKEFNKQFDLINQNVKQIGIQLQSRPEQTQSIQTIQTQEEKIKIPKERKISQRQMEKLVAKEKAKADRDLFLELKRMAKAWERFIVRPEKKDQRIMERENTKTLKSVVKMITKAERQVKEKVTKKSRSLTKSAIKKADKQNELVVKKEIKKSEERKPRVPKTPKSPKSTRVSEVSIVSEISEISVPQTQSVVEEIEIVVPQIQASFEFIELSVEEDSQQIVMMEASGETQDQNDNQDNDDNEESGDEEAYQTYLRAIKEYTKTEVCGKKKRRRYTMPEDKIITEEKRFRQLADGKIIHDKTLLRIPKNVRKVANKTLKSVKVPMSDKYDTLKSLVEKATGNTTNKVSLKFKIGENWMSTKVGSILDAIQDLKDKMSLNESNYVVMGTIKEMMITKYENRQALNRSHAVRGGRLIMDMNDRYLIISPQSDTNCFYHSLAYQVALLKGEFARVNDQDWIVEYARALKRQFGNDRDFADIEDVKKVADYYQCTVTIYDNLFHVIEEIKGNGSKKNRKSSALLGQHIRLQFKKNHCCLLVSRSQYPDFCEIYSQKKKDVNGENKPLKPKFVKSMNEKQAKVKAGKKTKRDRVIWSYDIEAYKRTKECGTQVPFAVGVCYEFNTENFEYGYQDFYGEQCAVEFFDFISNYNPKEKVDVFLYAHNGAKYDLACLNEVLLKRKDLLIDREGFVELNGAVISMTIKNQHDIEFTFRDSVRLFPGSLDSLCKDLKPKYAKITNHKFDFDSLTGQNIYTPELQTEIREYLRHDCLSLAQIMIEFREQLINDPKIEIDVTQCFTSATLAKKLFFEKYYWRYCDKKKNRFIYELNRELDTDIRKSYFGGRCDIYGYGEFKNVYYYDFTSLYPAVGAKQMYPIGNPVKVESQDIDLENFYGFVSCFVTTNKDTLPLHGHKFQGKLVFAHHEGTQMMLFSEEIKYGLSLGYKYEVCYGYTFDKAPLLKDIMTDGFKLKAESKANGQPVLEKTWKICINSAYGFFGLRWQDKRGVSIMTNDQLDVALSEKRVYNYNQISDDQFLVDAEKDLIDIKGKSIPVASAVTSYARLELYSVMKAIQDKGFKIHYSDTDSIITDCNLRIFPDLMERFMWDGCGNELGALKNECLDKCKSKLTKEELELQIEADGGELKFDSCQILAPKVYSLRKTLVNGKVIEIAKCKGVKESSYNEQKQLLEGQTIEKNVLQFKGGKNLYLMDQEIEGRIQVVTQKKNLCQFDKEGKLKYSKGYIVGQNVLPFNFQFGNLYDESIGKIQEPSIVIDLE